MALFKTSETRRFVFRIFQLWKFRAQCPPWIFPLACWMGKPEDGPNGVLAATLSILGWSPHDLPFIP